jgi:protein-tyrosine phosphatase
MRILALPVAALLLLPACEQASAPAAEKAILSPVAANEAALKDQRRVLDLEGGVNFRDLGGYMTEDGRVTKWETVYRSGSPADLTEADFEELTRRGIRAICDFRANEERASEPNRFAAANSDIEYWTRDYAMNAGDFMAVLGGEDASAAKSRNAMIGFYRELPEQHAESYRQMFRYLAEGRVPLAFNCSAGKDRAGVGAALILTLLGVPHQTVIADYALSDDVVDYRAEMEESAAANPGYAALAQLPWETVEPLVASDPAYLESAFSALESKYGSVDAFIERELGVTPEMKQQIRAQLTVEA